MEKSPSQSLSKSQKKRLRKKSNNQGPQEDGGEAQASIAEVKELELVIHEEVVFVEELTKEVLKPVSSKVKSPSPPQTAKAAVKVESQKQPSVENIEKDTKLVNQQKSDIVDTPASKPLEVKKMETDPARADVVAARLAKKAAKKNKGDKEKVEKPKTEPATKVEVKPENKPKESKVTEGKVNKVLKPAEEVKESTQPQKSTKEQKEERRLKQEAQRAAKKAATDAKTQANDPQPLSAAVKEPVKKVVKQVKSGSALYGLARTVAAVKRVEPISDKNEAEIHPSFVQLGAQLQNRVVRGCTAKAVALMRALGHLFRDYKTPENVELSRHLHQLVQQHMDYLDTKRPNSMSMLHAVKSLRINALPYGTSELEAKETLSKASFAFLEKLEQDSQSVALNLADKMANGDTVLVYSYSSLLLSVLTELFNDSPDFQVVVVGSKTHDDGLKMLRSLTEVGITCTYLLVNQVNFIIPHVQLVLLGAESMLANCSMIGRAGCAQVATVAKAQGVPVYACCETYNFSYQSHLSPFYKQNEAEPDFIAPRLQKVANLSQCSLLYDTVPERLLTAIITEVSVLPCSSVPVVLHMQSSDTVLKRRIKA